MTTPPTLNLSPSNTPGARAATNASYDSWKWHSTYDLVFNTRDQPNSSASSPIIIVPSNFPFTRILPAYAVKLFIVGKDSYLPSIVPDSSSPIVLENNGHATFLIRTNSGSIGSFGVADQDRDWSGQLQYDNKLDRWVFCTNRYPKAYLSSDGTLSVGKDLSVDISATSTKLHITGTKTEPGNWGTALAVFEHNSNMYIKLRTSVTGISGFLFSAPDSDYRVSLQHSHATKEFKITYIASGYNIGFDRLGSIIFSTIPFPYATMPLASSLFYLYGENASPGKGPHWKAHTPTSNYPLFQNLNYSHDNIALSFDCFLEAADWKSSHSSGSFQIYKLGGKLLFTTAQAAGGAVIPAFTNAMCITRFGTIGIGTTSIATSALLELNSTTGSLILTRMTTAQRNALTAVNGMILYNTDTGKVQVYESDAWASVV